MFETARRVVGAKKEIGHEVQDVSVHCPSGCSSGRRQVRILHHASASEPPAPVAQVYQQEPSQCDPPPPAPTPIVQYTPPPQPIQVVQYTPPQPVYQPPVVVQYVPQVVVKPQVTVNELRAKLSAWLGVNTNRYRHGKQSADDILPSESFRADILRFKNEVNAAKFASNPGFWSQIRIDFTRDGTVDEQWLLREGLLYKREVIDTAGRVVGTPEWFK